MVFLQFLVFVLSFALLLAGDQIEDLGIGFSHQVIYKNVPFLNIRFFPNSFVEQYQIDPIPDNGLIFDSSLGILSGVYIGDASSLLFRLTGSLEDDIQTASLTLDILGGCLKVL